MLQRVGIAQALINDPELVIFDEPMSGLDPLGRRDVRALILRLRDRGCTVFFSSHVLSDAEALCSRVAILARGRLVATGRLTDMLAFQVRGWELVVAGVTDALAPIARSARRGRVVRDRRRPVHARAAARSAARAAAGRARRGRRDARLAQSDSRDARGLLRRAGHEPGRLTARPRPRRTQCRRARREGDRLRSPSTSSASRCATRCSTTSCCSRSC